MANLFIGIFLIMLFPLGLVIFLWIGFGLLDRLENRAFKAQGPRISLGGKVPPHTPKPEIYESEI